MDHLPESLQTAIERLLAADAESDREMSPRSAVERIQALRAARTVIAEWRSRQMDIEEATRRIDALTVALRRSGRGGMSRS